MFTCPVTITVQRPARTRPRTALAAMITGAGRAGRRAPPRRARRRARAPAARIGGGHQERLAGLGGDEQRTGREEQAVAEVGHPRRPDEPAEPGAEARREDGLDESAHKSGAYVAGAARCSAFPAVGLRRAGGPRRRGRRRGRAAASAVVLRLEPQDQGLEVLDPASQPPVLHGQSRGGVQLAGHMTHQRLGHGEPFERSGVRRPATRPSPRVPPRARRVNGLRRVAAGRAAAAGRPGRSTTSGS